MRQQLIGANQLYQEWWQSKAIRESDGLLRNVLRHIIDVRLANLDDMKSIAAMLTQLTYSIGNETDHVYTAYIIKKQTGVEVCWRVADVSPAGVKVLRGQKVVRLDI